MQFGPIGIWSSLFRLNPREQAKEAVAELDELGFSTLWVPGGAASDILEVMADMLGASESIAVASGILNVWMHEPHDVARQVHSLIEANPGRVLLGLGVSHQSSVQAAGRHYERPYSTMVSYLDALDAADPAVSSAERVLAALGRRMLELSAERSMGAHPYCVPVEHTERARAVLGEGPLLAPEVKVVLEEDADRARSIARAHLQRYLAQPNYANNLLRLGYGEEDLAEGGSDALVDALVGWGDLDAVTRRVTDHLAAGADHVCLQVLTDDPMAMPRAQWRLLAEALLS